MFETLKIYTDKSISLTSASASLASLGYCRTDETAEVGDFSVLGDVLEIFPVNFKYPVRVELEYDTVKKIYSFDKVLNLKVQSYDLLIVIDHQ